ncbi:MAG: hypothetical protein ACJ74U_17790 [Jatrophihabitantaceae bacterium]
MLSIVIPFGLLMGKNGLVTAGAHRQARIPAPRLTSCADGQPIDGRSVPPGQCLDITGTGFGRRELLEVSDSRRPGWHESVWADELGRFHLRFQLPATTPAGADVLTFVGTDQASAAAIPAMAFCRLTVTAR